MHAARVLGRTGITPFGQHVEQVMSSGPYAGAAGAFWVVDNGCSPNGARAVTRMRAAWPTAELVHLSIHATWVDPVEILF
ncbi:hypothetical protein [Blastococcus deserti]|uniref:Uncharacterized protein n=1 Tax=Blastococcus deserti TaxID=2259033 RepID=A0ABW4XDV2_9ACTN